MVGRRGLAAPDRMMGLVLTAIAVEMLLKGIESFVRGLQAPVPPQRNGLTAPGLRHVDISRITAGHGDYKSRPGLSISAMQYK
jgi:MarC family integral membrane protein